MSPLVMVTTRSLRVALALLRRALSRRLVDRTILASNLRLQAPYAPNVSRKLPSIVPTAQFAPNAAGALIRKQLHPVTDGSTQTTFTPVTMIRTGRNCSALVEETILVRTMPVASWATLAGLWASTRAAVPLSMKTIGVRPN